MDIDREILALAAGGTGVGVLTLISIPSVLRLAKGALGCVKSPPSERGYQPLSDDDDDSKPLYEDEDGAATKESELAYSTTLPVIITVTSSIIGLVASTLSAVFALKSDQLPQFVLIGDWLDFAAWVLFIFQTTSIAIERQYTKKYDFGVHCGSSSLIFILAALIQLRFSYPSFEAEEYSQYYLASIFTQCFAALLQSIACFSIPRRPDVYRQGKLVDRQFTTSFIGKYSFQWPTPLLALSHKRRLEATDLPQLDSWTLSERVIPAFREKERHGKLWKHVVRVHFRAIAMQWTFAAFQCGLQFAPHAMLLQILRALERRTAASESENLDIDAWVWVICLGLVTMMGVVNDSRLFWTMWSKLAIPLRSQLQTLIFQKAMRRKDCKESKNEIEERIDSKSSKKGISGEKSKQSSQQDTINLVAVDTFRISSMAAHNYLLPACISKILISLMFLLQLLGWQSLLVGMVTNLVSVPLNVYFARRYKRTQKRLMKVRDRKLAVVAEVLQGIRQIKFSALENQWEERIRIVREEELTQLWSTFIADSVMLFCSVSGPVFLAAGSLSTYALVYGELMPSVAFTSLGVFTFMENQFAFLPDLITDILDARVSMNRIEKFFDAPEKEQNITPSSSISFEGASVGWPSDDSPDSESDRFILRNINVEFPTNELSVISGKTGSGKSLMLASLIGEVDLIKGKINMPKCPPPHERYDHKATADNWIIPSAVAFVSQIPFIENATIKDNILFGLPFDKSRYQKVLQACSLVKDLELFTDGDLTEVGAQGISLSGGQRWRLTFARALYSRAGILILDDLFSALDAHVGKEIFLNGLTGELAKGRTRILVTHHVALCLPRTKYSVMLKNGEVEHAGYVEDLRKSGVIGEILKNEEDEVAVQDEDDQENIDQQADKNSQPNSQHQSQEIASPMQNAPATSDNKKAKKFVEDEVREKGGVKLQVYLQYIKNSGGAVFWILVLLGYIAQQSLVLGRSWWVKVWTSSYDVQETSATNYAHSYSYQTQFNPSNFNNTQLYDMTGSTSGYQKHVVGFYIGIYAVISIVTAFMGTLRYFLIFVGSIRASRKFFYQMTYRVLRMPLRWVDTVPLGRILNRFTADFNILDSKLSKDMIMWTGHCFNLIGIVAAGLFVSPYIIFLSFVLLFICIKVGRHYLNGARDVKRLEAVAKSPIFEQFGSALKGVSTIRAFDKVDVFNQRMCTKVDTHATAWWNLWLLNRWVAFRMSFLGSFFATGVAAAVVSIPSIDAALAGFALAFSLQYTQSVQASVRQYANMELDMNSLERVIEYSNLKTEDQGGADVPAAWPSEGRLVVKNLVASYAPELPPVLKGLSFTVARNRRVGVIGRTGAGKSSLTLALFRFLQSRDGSIHIDGIDISKIKLHDLRSRMAIIPQDPVLFSGTIRSNLDPFGQFEDEELMQALARVHLIDSRSKTSSIAETPSSSSSSSSVTGTNSTTNKNIFESLSSPVSDGGHNLSQGQRQLLCLARAIISRPKIMVLDEATSAVDMHTDALIQRSIREEFRDSTVLCIAHRLVTVADFDDILVMSDGKAVEYGSPRELMERKGMFYGMVVQSGEKERLEEIIMVRECAK